LNNSASMARYTYFKKVLGKKAFLLVFIITLH